MSFDTGYCRMAFDDNDVVSYIHSAATYAWTPVFIAGQGVMIPIADIAANTLGAYRKRGILNFIVANGVTITKGEKVFFDSTNGVITTTTPTTGFLLGTAMQTGTGTSTGSVVVNVDINSQFASEGLVNVYGSNGVIKSSYATIAEAVAALVANDVLQLGEGSFTLAAGVNVTKGGVKIYGAGKKLTTVVAAAGADYAFKTVLGALAGSTEVFFGNMTIDHGDDATQVGIQVDNTAATKKLVVNIDNVDFESDGGNSVDIDHPDTTAAVRVRITGSYLEGPINGVIAHAEDQIHVKENSVAIGGIVTDAGNFDGEVVLVNSGVKNAGITGGHSNQRLIAINAWSETDANPNVYAGFVTGDGAGSHTETIWPAS